MTNLEKVKDLHINYVGTGKLLDGFELYYADNVVMSELGEEPRIGKDFNREYERNFIAGIQEIHGAEIMSFGEDTTNNKTMVEGWMDVTFTNGYRVKMQQVAVQTWENGLIVNELFYHK